MNLALWVLAIAVVLSVVVPYALLVRNRTRIDAREDLADDEILQRFYSASDVSKVGVLEVWHEIADRLGVPASKMRPGDRFGKEIGNYFIVSDGLDDLSEACRARAARMGIDVEIERINTVDEMVRALAGPGA